MRVSSSGSRSHFAIPDSPSIVSRCSQLRERGVARGFDFMKTYSRASEPAPTHARARIRMRAGARARRYVNAHPHSLYARQGDFSLYLEVARCELLTRLILGYAPTYLNSELLSCWSRKSRPTISRIQEPPGLPSVRVDGIRHSFLNTN
jgi:hypothetical protein